MDKVYDFNWIFHEIDSSIVLNLIKDGEIVSAYQPCYILVGGMNQVEVKFANIYDLEKFIDLAVIRFYDVANKYNIIDIPIRKLKKIYDKGNILGETDDIDSIKLGDLSNFSVIDGKRNNGDCSIAVVKFQEISKELMMILDICNRYRRDASMMEKFDALAELNRINYGVENNSVHK